MCVRAHIRKGLEAPIRGLVGSGVGSTGSDHVGDVTEMSKINFEGETLNEILSEALGFGYRVWKPSDQKGIWYACERSFHHGGMDVTVVRHAPLKWIPTRLWDEVCRVNDAVLEEIAIGHRDTRIKFRDYVMDVETSSEYTIEMEVVITPSDGKYEREDLS